jgi:hypothetical protein
MIAYPKTCSATLWKDLKLPEPTFQIDTGGKSIHSYWVFVKAIVAGKWYKLQTDLLEFGDGDRSIKNPARVMRLAGAWHISHDEDGNPIYNQTKIISCSGKTYTYEELREIIPSQEKEQQQTFTSTATSQSSAPNTENQSSSTKTSTKGDSAQGKQGEGSTKDRNAKADAKLPRHPDHITVPVSTSVPLLQCCRKEVREWVATGVPKGCQRNDTSINVGLELIGVERYLQTIGQSYSDSAQQLFHEFCLRSGMTAAEEEERFKWCFDINATPSCPPDAIEACIRGWYWREVIKPQQPHQQADKQGTKNQQPHQQADKQGTKNQQPHQQADKQGTKNQQPHQQADKQGTKPQDSPNNGQPPKNKIDLLHAVKKLLANFPQESLRHIALMELARNSGYPYREIEFLARIVQREEDIDEETALAIVSLSTHLNLHQQRLDISKYLEKNFADKMIAAALAMPTAQEYLFNTLLSAVASRGGTGLRVVANPSGGYVQPLIFWTGNVAHSGQAKTPPQQIIINPLFDLEEEAEEKFATELHEYKKSSSDTKPPTRKRYVLSNTTLPTKIRIHGENKRGMLEYNDELASDYRRLNQYKKGQGDDKENELSFFNGSPINYDRSDARLFLKRTGLSKTGSIQWDTLAQLMKDPGFIESGYMARFLFCSIGEAPSRYLDLFNENDAVQKLQESLLELYQNMEQLPEQDYFLCHDAKVLFQAWNHTLVDATKRESNFGFSLVYAKIEAYTLRLALWLHLVNSLERGEKPDLVIDGVTMKHAIEIASFYLGQQKLIWAHNDGHNQLEGMLLKIHTGAKETYQHTGEGVGASWAKNKFNALKKMPTDKIRLIYFQVLANNGYGQLQGEGKSMRYIPFEKKLVVNGIPHHSNPEQNLSNNQSKVGEVDVVGETLVTPPTSQMPLEKAFYQKVGEIGGETFAKIIQQLDEINQPLENNSSGSQNQPPDFHQFTNKVVSTIDEQTVTEVGGGHQPLHQPPITEPPVTEPPVTEPPVTEPPVTEPPVTSPDIDWLLTLLDEMESDSPPNWTGNELEAIYEQMEPKYEANLTALSELCPDYCDRFLDAYTRIFELSSPKPPTVDELKALLLACETLAQIQNLKKKHKKHKKLVKEAYSALTPDEQIKIDGIAATAVPHDVYKYLGPQKKVEGMLIEPGTLVYLDPASKQRNSYHFKVRLLQGVNQSWQKVLNISRDCLTTCRKSGQ